MCLISRAGGVVRDHVVRTLLWCVSAERVSSAYLVWDKQGGPTQVARKREHVFPIGKQEPNEETLSAPQELPRVSAVPRTRKIQMTTVIRGSDTSPATNFPASTTSVYSVLWQLSFARLQPLTSSTKAPV